MEKYAIRSLNESHMGWHTEMGGSPVEWLYVDGWTDDGYKFGVTMASKVDFGDILVGEEGDWPFVMCTVTNPDGETVHHMNVFPADQFKEEKPWGATIENNSLKGSITSDGQPSGYHMKTFFDGIDIDITATAVCAGVRFVEEEHGYMFYDQAKDIGVGWWPLIPRASVEGTITFKGKESQVSGIAHCERQLGNKEGLSMADWLSHWFWGHCWAGDYTSLWVYAAGPENKRYRPFSPLVLWKGSDIILSTTACSLSPERFEIDNESGRYYPVAETIHASEGNTELLALASTHTLNERMLLPDNDVFHCLRGFGNIDLEIRRFDKLEEIKGIGFYEQGQIIEWLPVKK